MTPDEARRLAITLVAGRERTAHEVHTKLVERGCSATDAEELVAALVADGSIDDRRAAETHVRAAARIKGRGPHRIEHELRARGIAKDVIRECLADVTSATEQDAIRRILTARRMPTSPDPVSRRRIIQQLLRRGFSSGAIQSVLKGTDSDDF